MGDTRERSAFPVYDFARETRAFAVKCETGEIRADSRTLVLNSWWKRFYRFVKPRVCVGLPKEIRRIGNAPLPPRFSDSVFPAGGYTVFGCTYDYVLITLCHSKTYFAHTYAAETRAVNLFEDEKLQRASGMLSSFSTS